MIFITSIILNHNHVVPNYDPNNEIEHSCSMFIRSLPLICFNHPVAVYFKLYYGYDLPFICVQGPQGRPLSDDWLSWTVFDPEGIGSRSRKDSSRSRRIPLNPTGSTLDPPGLTLDPAGSTLDPPGLGYDPLGLSYDPAGLRTNPVGLSLIHLDREQIQLD